MSSRRASIPPPLNQPPKAKAKPNPVRFKTQTSFPTPLHQLRRHKVSLIPRAPPQPLARARARAHSMASGSKGAQEAQVVVKEGERRKSPSSTSALTRRSSVIAKRRKRRRKFENCTSRPKPNPSLPRLQSIPLFPCRRRLSDNALKMGQEKDSDTFPETLKM